VLLGLLYASSAKSCKITVENLPKDRYVHAMRKEEQQLQAAE
jgi:hypothetical protein